MINNRGHTYRDTDQDWLALAQGQTDPKVCQVMYDL